MKKCYSVLLFFFVLFFTNMLFAQRVVLVEPEVPDALSFAVQVASAGDILQLSDGGTYPNATTITTTVPITIRTAPGFLKKARVIYTTNSIGNYPGNMFSLGASITIQNVTFDLNNGTKQAWGGRWLNRTNTGIPGGKILLDGVEVYRPGEFSYGGNFDTLIVRNSFFSGQIKNYGGWGAPFSLRGIKYTEFTNNTFTFCIFACMLVDGWGNYLTLDKAMGKIIIDHNTFYNISGDHGPSLMLSRTDDIVLTNNLFYNPSFRPIEYFSDKYLDFPQNYPAGGDSGTSIGMKRLGPQGLWIFSYEMGDSAKSNILAEANNLNWDPSILKIWSDRGLSKLWKYTNETTRFLRNASGVLDSSKMFFSENLAFTNAQAIPITQITTIADTIVVRSKDVVKYAKTTPYDGVLNYDLTTKEPLYDFKLKENGVNYAYPTTAKCYTASVYTPQMQALGVKGAAGYPLGDLNWFPALKANWEKGFPIGVGVPATPQNLTATAGNGQVTLKWNKNSESDFLKYRIYKGTTSGGETLFDSTSAVITDTTKTITGLTNGTTYYFKVSAMNIARLEGGLSNEVGAAPNKTILYVKAGDPSGWTIQGAAGSQYLELQQWQSAGYVVTKAKLDTGRITSSLLSNFSVLHLNLYWARAFTSTEKNAIVTWVQNGGCLLYDGASYLSVPLLKPFGVDTILGTSGTMNGGLDWYYSGAPLLTSAVNGPNGTATALAAEAMDRPVLASGNQFTIAATVSGYPAVVYRSYGSGKVLITFATGWCHDATFPGNAYRSDITQHGNMQFLNNVISYFSSGVPTNTPPSAPRNLTATAGNGQVTLKWNKNTEADFLKYRIYKGTVSGGETLFDSTSAGITDTTKTITGLTNGTTYFFKVSAMNSVRLESALSNEVSATPSNNIIFSNSSFSASIFYDGITNPDGIAILTDDSLFVVNESGIPGIGVFIAKEFDKCGIEDAFSTIGSPFNNPDDMIRYPDGTVFVSDGQAQTVFKIQKNGGTPVKIVTTSTTGSSQFNPYGLAIAPTSFDGPNVDPGDLIIADNAYGSVDKAIWAVNPNTGVVRAIARGNVFVNGPLDIAFTSDGKLLVYENDDSGTTRIVILGADGMVTPLLNNIPNRGDIAINPITDEIFFTYRKSEIYKIQKTGGVPQLFASNVGTYQDFEFNKTGTAIFLSANGGNRVIKITGPFVTSINTAPTATVATNIQATSFTANWNSVSNATGYRLDVSTNNGFNTYVNNYNDKDVSNVLNYSVTGLIASTNYYYRVRAYNTSGTSASSNTIMATTLSVVDITAPNAPTTVQISPFGWSNQSTFTITWTNPTDQSGIAKVWYLIDAIPTVSSPGTSADAASQMLQINLSSIGTHIIYLYLEDGAGNKNPNNRTQVTAKYDNSFPKIQHDSSAVLKFETASPQAIAIQATATDATSGVKSLQLNYRRADASWSSAQSANYTNVNGGTISIPASFISTNALYGVDYRISATDSANNVAYSSTHSLAIHISTTATRLDQIGNPIVQIGASSLSSGTPKEYAYRMFSVPLMLDNKTPQDILENRTGLGAYDEKKWRFFKLNSNDQFDEYSAFATQQAIDLGKAFFLILQDGTSIKVGPGTVPKTENINSYGIALKSGYNAIGNPFNFDVPIDSLSLATGELLKTKTIWEYVGVGGTNGGWKLNPTTLKAWEGILANIGNSGPTTLRFNVADRPSAVISSSKSTMFKKELAVTRTRENYWSLRIRAERDDNKMNDIENIIGVDPMASDDIDTLDIFEPPLLGDKSISVSFTSKEGALTHDFRLPNTEGYIWEIKLLTPDKNVKTTLTFDNIESLPLDYYLIDVESKMVHRFVDRQKLTVNTFNGTRNFRLIVGSKSFAKANSMGIDLFPKEFALYQNYPNPFNPSTAIRFALPLRSNVKLVIYDMLGREVIKLIDQEMTEGYQEVEWKASVSTGIYFYKIEMVSVDDPSKHFYDVKKMIFLK